MPIARVTGVVRWLLGVGIVAAVVSGALRQGSPTLFGQAPPALEPFKGVTARGTPVAGLFPIKATGVSTAPVRVAAEALLASLAPEQRARTTFPVDDDEWRTWYNVHRAARKGVSLREMSGPQRQAALALMQASLSARGFATSQDIMRLNGYIAELVNNPRDYGDDLYFFTVMGTPSETEPWGWQLDGHHLDINYFVLGDQVVMTPTFMGSEPVTVADGPYAGTAVFQAEQDRGLAFVTALTAAQRQQAVLEPTKDENKAQGQAFRDNLVLDYAGVRAKTMTAAQRTALLALAALYIGNMPEGQARVRMADIEAHLDDTWFAWIGATSADAVFYYRIHSPVALIEFDHQAPVALPGPRGVPTRSHIHTVVRTPNGNDYGRDLLRQHYEAHRHDPAHGHAW